MLRYIRFGFVRADETSYRRMILRPGKRKNSQTSTMILQILKAIEKEHALFSLDKVRDGLGWRRANLILVDRQLQAYEETRPILLPRCRWCCVRVCRLTCASRWLQMGRCNLFRSLVFLAWL